MTSRDQFESALRRGATYHADEGTSGYLLSEEAFAAILAAADGYRAAALIELAADLSAESKRQPYARRGLEFASDIALKKAENP